MKTIRRNATKQIESIFSRIVAARSYTLDNGFVGQDCHSPSPAREDGTRRFPGIHSSVLDGYGKLIDRGEGRFTVRYHSNHWVELEVA